MDAVSRSVKNTFRFALIWSILAVVGIPMIVFGAINLKGLPALGIPLLVAGCLFTGTGFYGLPLIWISYGTKRSLEQTVRAVTLLHLETVPALAAHLNVKEAEIRSRLDTCFARGYLAGYVRNGDTVTPYRAPEVPLHAVECPSCAAHFSFRGETGTCPYCGTTLSASSLPR